MFPRIFVLTGLLFFLRLEAQSFDGNAFARKTVRLRKNVAYILYGWSSANLVTSGIMVGLAKNKVHRSFHIGNLMWGAGNLVSAGLAHYNARKLEWGSHTVSEYVHSSIDYQRSLQFNAGLDVGYIGIGGFIWQLAKRKEKTFSQGFGIATAFNGAFLLVFDLVFVAIYNKHNQGARNYIDTLGILPATVELKIPF